MADYTTIPSESRVISTFDPGAGKIALIISGSVPKTVSDTDIKVDDAAMQNTTFRIAGLGFEKGEYTPTLLRCYRIDVPFSVGGSVQYVPFYVDRRTVYTNQIYVWSNNPPEISGSLFVGSISSGSVDPYIPNDGFDYSSSVAGANSSTLFFAYEHPTYRTTDRYNPILGDAMEDATEADGILIQTATGADKLYVHDAHRNFGIGATYAGQIPLRGPGSLTPYPDDSKAARLSSFVSGFISQTGSNGDVQLLDLSQISYKAISASVYVDRYNIEGQVELGSLNLTPISEVWKNLQQGNTDEPQMIFFTGQARIVFEGGKFKKIEEIGNRVTVPTTGSILFDIEGTNTKRFTNATIYAPFLNTVYRTDIYGVVSESWNETSEEV